MKQNLVLIGTCHRPHGIKGGFTFSITEEYAGALENGIEVMLRPLNGTSSISAEGKVFKLIDLNIGHKVMAYLQGVKDRNTAEALVPFNIFLDREILEEKLECEYLLEDLINFKVESCDGEKIGSVFGLYNNGAQDVLEIRGENDFDIPFIEHFVKEIIVKEKLIKIVKPEYLDAD
ncbi:MAG: 16S rRNA processing protein RimM [Halobacteriovoraceae bacterium]|jgi:16S rRNA processing protein RimM|nr:16S rRNA processing protein RimM [Halobacteriovoraceae bacterium]MBT5093853.1 16S rRNA processing protein RimM [Halobacteriovoraceae bacterium]